MSKYTEALLDIRYVYAQSQKYKKLQKYNAKRQLETLQELVDKATPKKPTSEKEIFYLCPICKEFVGDEYDSDNYCHNCGQAIDWSVEDDS